MAVVRARAECCHEREVAGRIQFRDECVASHDVGVARGIGRDRADDGLVIEALRTCSDVRAEIRAISRRN